MSGLNNFDHTYSGRASEETFPDGNLGTPDHTYFRPVGTYNSTTGSIWDTIECGEHDRIDDLSIIDTPERDTRVVDQTGLDLCLLFTYLYPGDDCEYWRENIELTELNGNNTEISISGIINSDVHQNASVSNREGTLPSVMGKNISVNYYQNTLTQEENNTAV